jgi:hypothetical protein
MFVCSEAKTHGIIAQQFMLKISRESIHDDAYASAKWLVN